MKLVPIECTDCGDLLAYTEAMIGLVVTSHWCKECARKLPDYPKSAYELQQEADIGAIVG